MIPYTALKSSKRHDLRAVIPLAKPFTVLIEPSSCCNFRCIQCFQRLGGDNYFTRSRMNMPLDRFRKTLADLRRWPGEKHKVLKLNLYGEPLVSPLFAQMLRIAREADVADRIETTTNASLLTPQVAEKMVELQLDYLRVSIYAPTQQRHEHITGAPVDIRSIHENLRILRETKSRCGSEKPFVSTKMLDAYGEENDCFSAMYRDVSDEVFIDKPHSWIRVDGADFLGHLYEEKLTEARADIDQHSTARIACPMPFTTMAVRANGDVAPCCVDFIGGTNLGNVDHSSMQELWESPAWFEFQTMQLENRKNENFSCARCDIYRSDHYTRDDIDGFPVERLRRPR